MRRRPKTLILLLVLFVSPSFADDRTSAVRWDFGSEETTPLRPHGSVHRDVPGPRPPEYPDFEPGNTAIQLDGRGAYFSFEDDGVASPFDFSNGDAISLEAWVRVDDLGGGENCYVIGKGRTGAKGFAVDNQNWALRVREQGGKACVSFLFATPRTTNGAQWHRWTSTEGFTPGRTWHHIAVSYRFGTPDSVRGWIDGRSRLGVWDMGGATVEPPVVDDDAIWIGSSQDGHASNSFRGSLDAIVVHRRLLDDSEMKGRYRREGAEIAEGPAPEVMPDLGELPVGRVRVSVLEGMPAHDRWLNLGEEWPKERDVWEAETFLLDRLPQRYDAWGIRDAWKPPAMVRLAADVDLKPGKRRFLMRVRGLSRLWVNGTLVARSKPLTGSPSGEEPMTPVSLPPKPGLRVAEHRQQDVFGEVEIEANGPSRIVLEALVGGKAFRVDPGETCVAVETPDGRSFVLLSPEGDGEGAVALTDEAVETALERQE
ncbi:MAG TPA: LamG domain-containing protein, partial [Isosphaeraceae bacterium]|nr:LamG domain-containing protein [Isosphaeraceae bacterium]